MVFIVEYETEGEMNMVFRMDLHTLPAVHMMGQVRQRMGWSNVSDGLPNILILVRSGDMTFEMNGCRYSLAENDWILLPQGIRYHVHSQQGCQYAFIHFRLDQPPELLDQDSSAPLLKLEPDAFPYTLPDTRHTVYLPVTGRFSGDQERIWAMLTECDLYRHGITPNRKLRIDLLFAEMLALLDHSRSQQAQTVYPPALTRILKHIHEHYTDAITLAGLSDVFGLSRQYIMRLFQKHLHITVTQYITQLKMSHALELLRHSTFRVGEVAEMLGYSNTYYFCRLFRQQFGLSPTEYIRHGMNNNK